MVGQVGQKSTCPTRQSLLAPVQTVLAVIKKQRRHIRKWDAVTYSDLVLIRIALKLAVKLHNKQFKCCISRIIEVFMHTSASLNIFSQVPERCCTWAKRDGSLLSYLHCEDNKVFSAICIYIGIGLSANIKMFFSFKILYKEYWLICLIFEYSCLLILVLASAPKLPYWSGPSWPCSVGRPNMAFGLLPYGRLIRWILSKGS